MGTRGRCWRWSRPRPSSQPRRRCWRCTCPCVRQRITYRGLLNPESKANPAKPAGVVDPNVREAQDMLRRRLGLKVTIEDKKGKGRVIIEYSGVEDFDAILTALGDAPGA